MPSRLSLSADNPVTLLAGDSRELCRRLPPSHFGSLVTDPPYGESILAHGDDSPEDAAELLRAVLEAAEPSLKPGAHVAIFWANRSVDRCIEAAKAAGYEFRRLLTMWVGQGNARPYKGWLPRSQPIVLMKKPGREIPAWRQLACATISEAMKDKGLTCTSLSQALGVSARLVTKWYRLDDESWSYPSDAHREALNDLLGIELPPQPEDTTTYRHDVYEVGGDGDTSAHPCAKPLWVVEDIIAKLGGPVLDPFCGSGTTLLAARRCGVEAVGIEIDPAHLKSANERLRQREMFA
jgi:hypothetical protein